jgi:hypothetical protein
MIPALTKRRLKGNIQAARALAVLERFEAFLAIATIYDSAPCALVAAGFGCNLSPGQVLQPFLCGLEFHLACQIFN